jgi:capsular exopolysaccharide synthesis family protein
MTKVFEALKNAKKNQKTSENGKGPAIPDKTAPFIIGSGSEYDLEEILIALYKSIETALPHTEKKIIQFVGSRHEEGTSTVVRRFAETIATRIDKSVLILDADRHEPCQNRFFRVKTDTALEDMIDNEDAAAQALHKIDNSNLFVGLLSKNAGHAPYLIDTARYDRLWEFLRERFDIVLIDSPPATSSADFLSLANRSDGVVLVVEADKTRWPVLKNVKDRIVKNGGNILGIVLNKRRHYIPRWIYDRM